MKEKFQLVMIWLGIVVCSIVIIYGFAEIVMYNLGSPIILCKP